VLGYWNLFGAWNLMFGYFYIPLGKYQVMPDKRKYDNNVFFLLIFSAIIN